MKRLKKLNYSNYKVELMKMVDEWKKSDKDLPDTFEACEDLIKEKIDKDLLGSFSKNELKEFVEKVY